MSVVLTYVRKYVWECFVKMGEAYCIHNSDAGYGIDAEAVAARASRRRPRDENFKTAT